MRESVMWELKILCIAFSATSVTAELNMFDPSEKCVPVRYCYFYYHRYQLFIKIQKFLSEGQNFTLFQASKQILGQVEVILGHILTW